MSIEAELLLLRAYLQTADRVPRTPTFERLLTAARQQMLAGCTVFKGLLGFGAHGSLQHSAWSLAEHLPVIVEILDSPRRIGEFLAAHADLLPPGATLTLAAVQIAGKLSGTSPASPGLSHTITQLNLVPPMSVHEDGILLRVFLGESDKFEHRPLHEAIVHKARELGLAGATVLRGVEGFGAHSVVHKAQLVDLSSDLPIVIEIVDRQPSIERLLPHLETLVPHGLVTLEPVAIVKLNGASDTSTS
jgi:PII-like signaling protein